MANNTPDTIPNEFQAPDLECAYRNGWNRGHGIACHNVPRIGDSIFSASLGRMTVDAENIREVHADYCYEAESNSRSFSPFGLTADEYNKCQDGGYRVDGELFETIEDALRYVEDNSLENYQIEEVSPAEELWCAFECGASDAICADLATYTDENYGIEEDV